MKQYQIISHIQFVAPFIWIKVMLTLPAFLTVRMWVKLYLLQVLLGTNF